MAAGHERATRLARVTVLTGRLMLWIFFVIIAYGAVAVVLALTVGVNDVPRQDIWQETVPMALLAAALAATVVYTVVILLYRSQKHHLTAAIERKVEEWSAADSPARGAAGSTLLGVTGFRAHARDAHTVELSWNPPIDAVDEVFVLRSTAGFAGTPESGSHQTVLCLGNEARCDDVGLEDDRVFFYTVFARSGADWSSPEWSWTVTPQLSALRIVLGTLRISRVLFFPWQHPTESLE